MTELMRTPPQSENCVRAPLLCQRYSYIFDQQLCTRKEMCQNYPERCRRLRGSPLVAHLSHTAPNLRGAHTDITYTKNARPISLLNAVPKPLSFHYDITDGRDYLSQRFVMKNLIGCGSFGAVAHMISKDDGNEYAIKYKTPYKSQRNRYEQLREVMFLEFTNHPNVVKFYCAWEEQDILYIQTELCVSSLHRFIYMKDGNVPLEAIWNVLLDVLRALVYLHSNSIIHLDVKPENILLNRDNIAKLADFGLAFDAENDNPVDCLLEGDSRYLAAEALDDSVDGVSPKRDIYSLGVSILQLATDIWIPNQGRQLSQIRNLEFPENIRSRIPSELRPLIYAMMAKDPNERPAADQILHMDGIFEREAERREFVKQHSDVDLDCDERRTVGIPTSAFQRLQMERRKNVVSKNSLGRLNF